MKQRLQSFLLLVVCALFSATVGHAQQVAATGAAKDSSKEPIEISADTLEVDQVKQVAVFTGNVVAVQGDMRLRSRRMVVYYRKKDGDAAAVAPTPAPPVTTAPAASPTAPDQKQNAIQRIEVYDDVVLATPEESAQGTRGEYEVDKKLLHLIGNVILTRGQNILRGTQLDYNLATGRSVLVGGNSAPSATGGRVRGVFVPDSGT